MSKTIVIAQLQQLELEAFSVVQAAQELPLDRQVLSLLERAELEHACRAKSLGRALDEFYGSHDWKKGLGKEQCGVPQLDGVIEHCGSLDKVEAAELRLNRMYEMATELIRNPSISEAAAEQQSLCARFTELKFVQTKKIKISA